MKMLEDEPWQYNHDGEEDGKSTMMTHTTCTHLNLEIENSFVRVKT